MTRRIDVTLDAHAALDLASVEALLERAFDGGYLFTQTSPTSARAEFLSIGGPQPAFALTALRSDGEQRIALDLTSVDRDYCAAATVAEELARRHGGRAIDGTTRVQLWPPVDGGATHPTIARTCLCFEIDADDGERVIPALLETARRHFPAALPSCFSDREPFLCETPGDEAALLALSARQAHDGGTVCWLAARLPALDGYLTWPRRAGRLIPDPIRLKLGIATAALDEGRLFAAELARATHARSSTIDDGGAIQLRLGTTWVIAYSALHLD